LLVALDDLGGALGCLVRIETRGLASLALMKQVVGPVEFDLDRLEPLRSFCRQTAAVADGRIQLLLLGRQRVDLVEDIEIGHDGHLS
jgi:hypothetical protein